MCQQIFLIRCLKLTFLIICAPLIILIQSMGARTVLWSTTTGQESPKELSCATTVVHFKFFNSKHPILPLKKNLQLQAETQAFVSVQLSRSLFNTLSRSDACCLGGSPYEIYSQFKFLDVKLASSVHSVCARHGFI